MQTVRHDLEGDRRIDHSRFSVLFVDDEVENLRVFELAFRREFRIKTANSPEEGLEMIAEDPVAVVLSDHRMPGMTGVEFLTRVREFDPNTVRMLVTAYGDFETLSDAINEGCIYRFIPKPWIPEEMRITLRNALDAYARESDRQALMSELEVLNRSGSQLCSELETPAVLDRLLNVVVEELRFDGATVLLLDSSGERLQVARSAPRDNEVHERLAGMSFPVDRAECFRSVLEGRRVERLTLGELFELESSVRDFAAEIAAEEMLLVPLPSREGSAGVLAVDNRRGGEPFERAHRTLLTGLASQAAIAIENARLVDDLRREREQTRRADRLGTLGTLAAGLAHEINNPLVSVQTFLKLAPERRTESDEEFWDEYHNLACREVERIRSLVQSMSGLGRDPNQDGATPAEPCDLGELCREATQLLEGSTSAGEIQVECEFPSDLPKVSAVRDHLHQVVTNLLLNAIHATPRGGRVAVRGACEEGERVCLEVQDWGCGIPPDHLEKIFDPFFTTKGPDEGSGLGLMIAHRIVSDHGGQIEVESGEGQGSTFRVLLPVH